MGNTITFENEKNMDCTTTFGNKKNIDKSVKNIEKVYSYVDYINAEKDYKNSLKFDADKKYWNEAFSTLPEQATIPSLARNHTTSSQAAKRLSFDIDKTIIKKINQFCKENHFSVFSFFMAIFSIYLGRVSNSQDFVIGTPILNRTNRKEKCTTGMFVNTAPVRVNLANSTSFLDLANDISKNMMGILRHQKYSYNSILEDLRAKNLSNLKNYNNISNLYNIMISYQVTKAFDESFGNYETHWTFNNFCANDLDIHIYDINDTGNLSVSYDYLICKYSENSINDIHSRILYIINQVLNNKTILIENFEIVTKEEKNKIIYDYNNTKVDLPKDNTIVDLPKNKPVVDLPKNKTIIDLFEEQAKKAPDSIAVSFENKSLTYKELNEKANRFARFLPKAKTISILLDKNIDLVISLLAVLKSGACYVPISPDYPKERIDTILEDSKSDVLITCKKFEATFKNCIYVDHLSLSKGANTIFDSSNLHATSSDDLAYIIYTSGSTGKPKGVTIGHLSLLNYICWANKFYCNNEPTNFPLYSSIGFDLTVTSIFTPLINGGTVLIYKAEDMFLTLKDIFEKSSSSVVKLTPAHLSLLNEFDFSTTNVKKLIVGGDVLSPEICKRVTDKFKNIEIYNEYGPTEATVGCMIYKYCEDSAKYNSVPIGVPIDNTQIYILDKALKPVPPGTSGDLYISGSGLSKGYLGRSDLTQKAFVKNPFVPNTLMYKSGDIGVFAFDGNILCLGRSDNQVKIRGFRIELGEIEDKIHELPFIKTCIVVKKSNSELHDFLCAYYVASEFVDPNFVKKHLQNSLPRYMIPSSFIQMDSLPFTTNGKIDRSKLPNPQVEGASKQIVLPRNEVDSKVVNLLENILNIHNISIEDDFFELGGDSLSAINLSIKIQSEFDVHVSVKDILENSVIKNFSDIISKKLSAECSNLISENLSTEHSNFISEKLSAEHSNIINKKNDEEEKIVITPVQHSEYYDVSSSQKSIYFSTQMAGKDSILYNTPGGVILEGNVDIQKLEKCLNILIKRHESLRTYFEVIDGNVVQKIADNFNFKLDVVEKTIENLNLDIIEKITNKLELNATEKITNKLELNATEKITGKLDLDVAENKSFEEIYSLFKKFVKPFDLSCAPLFRAQLIKFDVDKYVLFIDMHHIISDGMSLAIFTEEICKLYNGEKLEDLPFTYKDFVYYEKQRLETSRLKEAEDYWINQFKDEIPVLDIPTSFPRPAVQSFKGAKVYSKIEKTTYKDILNLSKKIGVTPYMLLLSCYYILLYKYTSQDDIVVGSPIVGRDNKDLQKIIGMFVNTLPLRNKVDSSLSFKDFVANIKQNVLQAYNYQAYPLDELVNKLNIKRDTSRNPLFDTLFVYQNNGYKDLHFDNIKSKYFIPDTNISKFDLSVEAVPNGDEINLSFEYATGLFEKDFIKNLSNHYLNILKVVLSNLDIKLSEICMLSDDEKNTILYDFNNTYSDYPKDKTIIELFEEQAQKKPDNIAVIFEGNTLTYRELNEKANQLANFLITKKITNKDIIGIKLNRSFDLIISIYAVIKSGASYVLIDPSFPEERIHFILEDSNAKFCIESSTIEQIDFANYSNQTLEKLPKEDLCVIYTSGSTGKPKGVVLKESGFINLIYSFDKDMNISTYKNILGIASVSFDMFAVELFSSTLFGNTLVLANEEEQKSPILISNLITKNHVEFFVATPSRVELLLSKDCNNPLKNVKAFQLGGEIFSSSLYNKLIQYTKAKIYNGYGPTEITACCTNKLVDSDKITIGKPISNVKAYICDSNLGLQPIGLVGEICIAGVGISKGYINNTSKTNESFVKNPFGEGYLYKTGDLGKFTFNGEIEYIGRIDNQIKLRGLRIELGEIESIMCTFPNIQKAKVVKQNINGHDILSAYFTASKKLDINELRKFLSNSVPQYMMPSYFTALEHFPYNNNGKLDIKSLPIPTISFSNKNYDKPETELQKILVSIWEKLLNIDHIGINDNFFDLGGDSLLAMSLNVELLKLSNTIKYSDIFRYPTIALLEEKIYSNNNKLYFNKIENLSENFVDILDNTTQKIKISKYHPKHVLLTGSTGFLGIHILEQLINNEKGNIYCIVRDGKNITVREKLLNKLHYYFGNKYDDLIDTKIVVIKGNVSLPDFGLNKDDLLMLNKNIDIVINCAANVSHFGNYKDFYNSNVKSTQYIINYCKAYEKKLYHISTTSISGSGADLNLLYKKHRKKNIFLRESNLYVGQIIDNVYARSKFEAENSVLNAISNGLDGYILRMGNLMPRYSDGHFQENVLSNSFINKLLSFINIGFIPRYLLKHKLEFTPVDFAANAIYHIITNCTNKNRIFHVYNHNYVSTKKFIYLLKKSGINIEILDEDVFVNRIKKIISDDSSKNLLKNIIDDFDKNLHLNYDIDIIIKSNYTIRYLKKTNFKWPKTNKRYLLKFIELLRKVI